MSERMCMHIFEYARTESIVLHHTRDEESRETDSIVREEGRIDISATVVVSDEEGGEVVRTSIQIRYNRISSSFREIDNTEFASLTSYSEF